MNATESNLLVQADHMSESMLVGLADWELAYLRAAMLHQVEETLNESMDGIRDTPNDCERAWDQHRMRKQIPTQPKPEISR